MNLDVSLPVHGDFRQEPRACQQRLLHFCTVTPSSRKWAGEWVPGVGPTAASLATLTDSCSSLGELARTGLSELRLPRVGPDVPRPAMTHCGSGVEGLDCGTGRVRGGLGGGHRGGVGSDRQPWLTSTRQPGAAVVMLGSPVSLSLSCEDKQRGFQRRTLSGVCPSLCFSCFGWCTHALWVGVDFIHGSFGGT